MTRRRLLPLLLYLLFVVYGTSIPFEADFASVSQKWRELRASLFVVGDLSLPDVLSNLLLFVPFGWLFAVATRSTQLRAGVGPRQLFLTTAAGAAFSLLVELWQLALPSRTTSLADVAANSAGAFAGAVLAAVFLRASQGVDWALVQEGCRRHPTTSLVTAFFLIQLIGSWFPFDISLDVSGLKEQVKRVNLMPLGSKTLLGQSALPFSWPDFIERTLLFSMPGYLSIECLGREWKGRRAQLAGALLVLPVLAEFSQLLVQSRAPDVNDILSSWAGLATGALFYSGASKLWPQEEEAGLALLPTGMLPLYASLLVVWQLSPFALVWDARVWQEKWTQLELLPFGGYYSETSLSSLYDLLSTVLLAVPIGLFARRWNRERSWGSFGLGVAGVGLLIGCILEGAQLSVAGRHPGVTDVLSFGIGAYAGNRLGEYCEKLTDRDRPVT